MRSSINHKISADVLSGLISKLVSVKTAKENKSLLLVLSDLLAQSGSHAKSLEILRSLYQIHTTDKQVLGRYLSLLVDSGNLQEAAKIQQKLALPEVPTLPGQEEPNEDDYLQHLIEDGMPEKRKEKKTRDIIQETKGGAEIFMPSRKRKR